MSGPTEQERELRSGRYKGIRLPASLMPVDDPAHAAGLRWFREGVDAALDTVQASVDHAVAVLEDSHVRRAVVPGGQDPDALVPFTPAEPRTNPLIGAVHCLRLDSHASHYWFQGAGVLPQTHYCPGWP